MEKTEYLWWSVPAEKTELPKEVTVLVVESLAGKCRLFFPGRRSSPLQVREFNKRMVAYAICSLTDYGWMLEPKNTVGISILTEGAGVPFLEAFDLVWPGATPGGVLHVWARRQVGMGVEEGSGGTYAKFAAQLKGLDTIPSGQFNGDWTGVIFDIGATGATTEVVVSAIASMFKNLVFASPCTSLVAAKEFVKVATANGIGPECLAIVPMEGFLGLHTNGTYLSLQMPGAITSWGNKLLSLAVYPHPHFCHIGAGGLAANWPQAYQEELRRDEGFFGELPFFDTLEEVMNHAGGLRWPDDFGSPF